MFGLGGLSNRGLKWQLWASHFTVIFITLVALVGSLVLLMSVWLLRQGFLLREPGLDAQFISSVVGNLVRRGAPEAAVANILSEVQTGAFRAPLGPFESERALRFGGPPPGLRADLQNLQYVVVVRPGGQVLASSDPSRWPPGSTFTPPNQPELDQIIERALAGERDPTRLSLRVGGGLAVGAYPIGGSLNARPVGAVALAKQVSPSPNVLAVVGRAVAAFGFASMAVLAASSVFALTFSGVAAYMLSRRLGARLERLSRAADAVAQGDLSQRVDPGAADEVGRFSERFNLMAERLQESMLALEVERKKAETSLNTRRELVANVSHELRTPLASIRGHVESLGMGDVSGTEQLQYLEVIEREVDHLSRLIDDLFALSTTEAGAASLNLQPLSLPEVVGEVASALAPLVHQERQITLVSDIDSGIPHVLADRQRLVQVLANLLRNAIRYTPEGGLISLSAARADGHVEVAVADTGLGIPPGELPHVFERFYRGSPARDRASGGAGLGLALVREFVEAMGGRVAVESTVGEGSRFCFTLPAAANDRLTSD